MEIDRFTKFVSYILWDRYMHTHVCLVTQLCLTLWDFMDCNLPGSSVHGILQARILEWVTMHSSRGSFQPKDQTQGLLHCRWILCHLSHQGSSYIYIYTKCIFLKLKSIWTSYTLSHNYKAKHKLKIRAWSILFVENKEEISLLFLLFHYFP